MTKRKAREPVAIAAISLLACAAIGAYLSFTGLNGHPEQASADVGAAQTREQSNPPLRGALSQIAQGTDPADGKSGKTFNDWTIRCQKNEQGEVLSCEALQRLSVRDTGQRFLELAVGFPPGSDAPLAIFVLPLGLWLPPGMDFQIDDGSPMRVPVQRCIQGGCLVQLPLNDELLTQLKGGKQLAIQVYRQANDPMAVPISLLGFTAALREIKPQ